MNDDLAAFDTPDEAVFLREDDGGTMHDVVDWEAVAQAKRDAELASKTNPPAFPTEANPDLSGRPYNAFWRANDYTMARLRVLKQEPVSAVPCPFPSVNRMCLMAGGQMGAAHGWEVIVAAASNKGKTQIGLNWAVSALRHGESVTYFGLESDIEELGTRVAAIAAGRPMDELTRGKHFDIESDRMASTILTELPGSLFLNSVPIYEVKELMEVARAFAREYGARTFVVDHMQIAEAGDEGELARRTAQVSHAIRQVAKEDGLLAIGLSQLTTGAAREGKSSPTAYDVLGGAPVFADADLILVVDHSERRFKTDVRKRCIDTVLIVGKNRHGPTGHIDIRFDFTTSRAVELIEGPGPLEVVEPTTSPPTQYRADLDG